MSKPECLVALIFLILYASAWSMATAANPIVEGAAGGERRSGDLL
jgi:hypothetical protein